ESPRWLASKGREEEAQNIIYQLTGNKVKVEPVVNKKVKVKELFTEKFRKRTIFVCGFWFCYATAYYGISMYTPTILASVTEATLYQTYVASSVVSAIGLIDAPIGTYLIDGWDRRPLLITSIYALTVGLTNLTLNHNH